jgi:hypothetical protein
MSHAGVFASCELWLWSFVVGIDAIAVVSSTTFFFVVVVVVVSALLCLIVQFRLALRARYPCTV